MILELGNNLGIEVDKLSKLHPALTDEYMMFKVYDILFSYIRDFGALCFLSFVAIYLSFMVSSCDKEHKKMFIKVGNILGFSGTMFIIVSIMCHVISKIMSPNINMMLEIMADIN